MASVGGIRRCLGARFARSLGTAKYCVRAGWKLIACCDMVFLFNTAADANTNDISVVAKPRQYTSSPLSILSSFKAFMLGSRPITISAIRIREPYQRLLITDKDGCF